VSSLSFVALGDSFTEGLEDEVDERGRHRGWADRVAVSLAAQHGGIRYANLAVRGRLLDEVVDQQLPQALDLGADLVSFHAGPNDVLRPRRDVADVVRRYDRAVALLADEDRRVLLFTVIERAGGTGRTADRLAARFAAFNAGVRASARRHGALLVDVGSVPALQDRRLWHEDRLHLAPEGHARVAAAVLAELDVPEAVGAPAGPGWWRTDLPPAARARGRWADVAGDLRWARRYLLPWVGRRLRGVSSGDLVVPKHSGLVEVLPPQP
jgi:lysophospholipase L1-like esterase